ncbi:Methyltransferase-like protein 16 [Yarrowia sp. B02]|nr:Methyltransferase-like protein 16 [Yarrowia sp. B02]
MEWIHEIPALKPFVKHGKFDFSTAEANCAFTEASLAREHNLTVELDTSRLCPRVPIRKAYVEWIHELLPSECDVTGLDIGTGTSCIYPLLASKMYGWRMLGSDIDEEAIEKAQKNADRNPDLADLIKLRLVSPDADFFDYPGTDITFTMCNPPFYASFEEMETSLAKKSSRPAGELQAAQTELITKDGELGFLQRMIRNSKKHKDAIMWFTSMVGKKETMEKVVEQLKEESIYHAVVSRRPGKTKRWFVAWTFSSSAKHESISGNYDLEAVEKLLINNDIPCKKIENGVVALPKGDVWSRKYKRAKLRKENVEYTDQYEFWFSPKTLVWRQGQDKTVWDSFGSWISRNLKQSAESST